MDAYELRVLNIVNVILNGLSGGCGLVVVVALITLILIQPEAMNRVSIRFTLAVSLVDFLKAVAIIFYIFVNVEGSICVGLAFATQWLTLVYLSLNVAIAINLQLVFVEGRPFDSRWERRYWVGSLLLPSLIMVVPLTLGKLGFDSTTQTCEYKTGPSSYLWLWSCWLIWMVLACVYCFVIVLLTIVSLKRKANLLDQLASPSQVKKDIKSLILRVSLYCIIPTITQMWFVIFKVYWHHTRDLNIVIVYLSVVGSDLPGILNLVALLLDPAFKNAIRHVRSGPEPKLPPSRLVSAFTAIGPAFYSTKPIQSPPPEPALSWRTRLRSQASISDISLENMGLKERTSRNHPRRASAHHTWATNVIFPPIPPHLTNEPIQPLSPNLGPSIQSTTIPITSFVRSL
ncbi:hypothetical protein L0F63_004714 [Massospora cicadina]|nr:hypothetical protein L0F63_004714 [Massospora cicadina]